MSLHKDADQNADQLVSNTMKLNGGVISVGCLLDNGYTRGITKAQLRIAVQKVGLKHDEVDGKHQPENFSFGTLRQFLIKVRTRVTHIRPFSRIE